MKALEDRNAELETLVEDLENAKTHVCIFNSLFLKPKLIIYKFVYLLTVFPQISPRF